MFPLDDDAMSRFSPNYDVYLTNTILVQNSIISGCYNYQGTTQLSQGKLKCSCNLETNFNKTKEYSLFQIKSKTVIRIKMFRSFNEAPK